MTLFEEIKHKYSKKREEFLQEKEDCIDISKLIVSGIAEKLEIPEGKIHQTTLSYHGNGEWMFIISLIIDNIDTSSSDNISIEFTINRTKTEYIIHTSFDEFSITRSGKFSENFLDVISKGILSIYDKDREYFENDNTNFMI